MTYREAVTEAAARLKNADILFCDTPLLDSSVLLAYAAGISREKLFASYPEVLTDDTLEKFREMIKKRLSGRPVSYIRNIKEFYGRDFFVDESVLVPRPDTEVIIDRALNIIDLNAEALPGSAADGVRSIRLFDLCTGSGCIASTLKLERPGTDVTASDISPAALDVAKRNACELGADISFIESNLFDEIRGRFDIIVTNPPYLTNDETGRMRAAGWPEPAIALDGGKDGLDFIRIIIKSSLDYLSDNGYLLIEAGPEQAREISNLFEKAGFSDIEITADMAGRNRVTSGRKSGTYN